MRVDGKRTLHAIPAAVAGQRTAGFGDQFDARRYRPRESGLLQQVEHRLIDAPDIGFAQTNSARRALRDAPACSGLLRIMI